MIERTTVRLEQGLLRAAKKKAAEEGRTLTSLIEEGLRAVIHGRRETNRTKPGALPISSESGGLRPGFDLSDMSTIYGAEDEDYIDKMRKGFK